MESTDVLIIGGGVIGCAIAYFLRKRHIAVTVLERGAVGSQASGAAAGLLAPLGPLSGPGPFADLVLAGYDALASLVPEIEDLSGMQVGYEQTGALRVVRHPKRIAHLQKRFTSWQPLGLQLFWLSGEEARAREPELAPDVCAAVYAPQEAQIQAPTLVQAFARAAERLGATILPYEEVHEVYTQRHRVSGVSTVQGRTFGCQRLILASGAWAAQCASWFHLSLPIHPLHGQMILLPQTTPPLTHILFGEAAYLVPRGENILVGATKEERGFDSIVTEQATSWLSATAARLVPDLAQSPVTSAWAGLRPKTPDSRPIIDFLPHWDNVVIAAGHNSVGVILSAITGICVTEMLTTEKVPPLIQPFSVTRFLEDSSSLKRNPV